MGDSSRQQKDKLAAFGTTGVVGDSDSSHDGGGDEDCGAMCAAQTRRFARDACTIKQVTKRVPIITWLPKYDVNKAISDVIAGITVGLTVIPQGIAYANVAELPEEVRSITCNCCSV